VTQLDPVAELEGFLKNSRAHAAFWLQHGNLHPEAHHIIVARDPVDRSRPGSRR
jgi:hypothetical protein